MLWDITEPAKLVRIATIKHANLDSRALAMSPDGRRLAVRSDRALMYDKEVVPIWDYAALNDLRRNPAKRACAVTGRGLTEQEWERYIPVLPYQPTCTD